VRVPVEVIRLIKTGDIYGGMGIKLLEQPQNYLELVDSLRYTLMTLKHSPYLMSCDGWNRREL
jgi:hypothetical protein